MRERNNYWLRRVNSSRLSRRRFVGGAASVGVGAAGFALVGCGDDDDDDDTGGETPSGGASPTSGGGAASPTPGAASPTADAGAGQQGGIYRASSANNTYDSFDADRSRFTPFAALLGYTNLGIVEWDSFAETRVTGALAESWETPDDTTIVFKLKPGMKWHNKPPVDGRDATVEDLKFFIERNKNGVLTDGTEDPNFYRKTSYQKVASVEATDPTTLTVKFTEPDPFFITTLAGQYSKVQAPEAVEAFEKDYATFKAEFIIGTGPYILTEFRPEGDWDIERNPDWQGVAYLDGIKTFPLFTDEAARQGAFEQKQIDSHTPNQKANLDDLLSRYEDQIFERAQFSANPMAGTYYGGEGSTWQDQRLIGAIFRTIDRRQLIQQMFQGRGALSGNVPPTQQGFAITEQELIELPGYLEDRAEDMAEAKAMWEAAGGPALGTITVDIPDIWEGAYSGVSQLITTQLSSNLGNTFEAKIEPYSTISPKIVQQGYGGGNNKTIWYGWIEAINDPEPSLGLFVNYNSTSPNWAQFGVKIDEVDSLTAELVQEMDVERRAELAKQIDKLLIENYGAGVPYNMVNINNTVYWNYVNPPESAAFVTQHLHHRQLWLKSDDPTFEGRQA